MEIIKSPEFVEYYGKCYECGCEFRYNPTDIHINSIPPHIIQYSGEFINRENFEYVYVNCPFCGRKLNTDNISKRELGIVRIRNGKKCYKVGGNNK